MRIVAIRLEERPRTLNVDAELGLFLARRRIAVRLRIDVGVDAQGGQARDVESTRNRADVLELVLRLDVEPADPLLEKR